jgi:type IV pilus assembly protein PilA
MDTLMYFALMGKLSARRQNLAADKDKGFTLIELLVVVIIIGILAAIAIPVYLGVQNNARDASVKSDLSNAKTAVIGFQTDTGKLPTALNATTLGKYGYTVSSGNTLAFKGTVDASSNTFCIDGSGATGKKFSITDSAAVVEGACA